MRGRARLRVPALRGDDRLKRALEAGLGGNGIRSAAASTATGTVLVIYDPARPLAEIERRVRGIAAARPVPQAAAIASDDPRWHSLDADRALARFGSSRQGLREARVRRRRRQYGPNRLLGLPRRSGVDLFVGQFRSLPVALLTATALLSLLTGGVFDGVVVLAVILLNGLLGFAAEGWSEQAISSLEKDAAVLSRVLRDGRPRMVVAEDLVPGDIIIVRRDEPVPADARLIDADRLAVNEASLTGESVPVAKAANVLAPGHAPLGDRRNMLYRGTVVTGGSGRAVVVAIGDRTELARIQAVLGSAVRPQTPLQQQLDELGRLLVLGSVAAAVLMLLVGVLRGHRLLRVLRSAVSLGVAAVPEGLPTMVTTALAVNARRLLRSGLLVRRFEAIEALGTVDLVCFDKTGTLTLNRMTVTRLAWNGHQASLDGEDYRGPDGGRLSIEQTGPRRLCEICVLCNDAVSGVAGGIDGSPTEAALLEAAERVGVDWAALRQRQPRLSVVERAEGRRYMMTVHGAEDGRRLVAVKGDPLAVLPFCRSFVTDGVARPLDAAMRDAIAAENQAMAQAGLRVLGVACRENGNDQPVGDPPSELTWLGLVGMADRIRGGAAELVRGLQRAGIATAMLTGDQRATALAIAAEAGLAAAGRIDVVEGDRLDAGHHDGAAPRVYARLAPAQKLQVIADLQHAGLRVAMVGDGVNDTPALKAADVGITLAASATAVARDVADIVLLGDDLRPLFDAFATGRAVRGNVRRGVRFLVATNLSEILLMLFATATGLARPLTPAQLLWINLVSDVLPAIGLALEAPRDDILAAPPAESDASASVIGAGEAPALLLDATLIAGSALAAETWTAARRGGRTGAAAGFATLMTAQLLYALACRADRRRLPDAALTGALGAAFAAEAAALFLPGLRNVAGASLGLADLSVSAAAALPALLAGRFSRPRSDAAGPGFPTPRQ